MGYCDTMHTSYPTPRSLEALMIVTVNDLDEIRTCHMGETLVLVGGVYDLLHVGHVSFLQRCVEPGNVLIVAASSDMRTKQRKGLHRPIIPETERVAMLAALSIVDYALIAPDPVPDLDVPTVRVIAALRPDIFATSEERFYEYRDNLRRQGTEVRYVPEIRQQSTTRIIEQICRRYSS